MARTPLTVYTPVTGDGYPSLPLSANAAAVVPAAGNVADGNDFIHTGRELIMVRNSSGATPYAVTIYAAPDRFGRSGNIVHTLAANAVHVFGPFPLEGWRQSDGKMWLGVANASLLLTVVHIPDFI